MYFLNLKAQYESIKPEIDQAISLGLKGGMFAEGQLVKSFENEFAITQNAKYCVALSSGTAALHTVLDSVIQAGDRVILPANTCFPTAEAVYLSGATPVFVDCEDQFFNLDPDKIATAASDATKAVVVVHLYGQPAQMDKIKKIADKYALRLIEDCAQAHMASFNGTMVGNFGAAGTFSFYPTKNLGAFGEAGAVVSKDLNLVESIRAFKNHGSTTKNVHEFIGHNYRMDNLQAAILSVKLKHLEKWTEQRRQNAQSYYQSLTGIGDLVLPEQHPKARHVFHQFVIRTNRRDKLQQYLRQKGIETAIHYPVPCHLQPALKHLGYSKGSFPVSEKLSDEILSLPVAEHLASEDIRYICDCIKNFF